MITVVKRRFSGVRKLINQKIVEHLFYVASSGDLNAGKVASIRLCFYLIMISSTRKKILKWWWRAISRRWSAKFAQIFESLLLPQTPQKLTLIKWWWKIGLMRFRFWLFCRCFWGSVPQLLVINHYHHYIVKCILIFDDVNRVFCSRSRGLSFRAPKKLKQQSIMDAVFR